MHADNPRTVNIDQDSGAGLVGVEEATKESEIKKTPKPQAGDKDVVQADSSRTAKVDQDAGVGVLKTRMQPK